MEGIKIIEPKVDRFPVIDQALEIASELPAEHPDRVALLLDVAVVWRQLVNPLIVVNPGPLQQS